MTASLSLVSYLPDNSFLGNYWQQTQSESAKSLVIICDKSVVENVILRIFGFQVSNKVNERFANIIANNATIDAEIVNIVSGHSYWRTLLCTVQKHWL